MKATALAGECGPCEVGCKGVEAGGWGVAEGQGQGVCAGHRSRGSQGRALGGLRSGSSLHPSLSAHSSMSSAPPSLEQPVSFYPRVSVSSGSANASGEGCAAGVRGDLLGLHC